MKKLFVNDMYRKEVQPVAHKINRKAVAYVRI